jgi:hypothetical protein
MAQTAGEWAWEEFGDARLGDVRRRRRLIATVARVAETPAGRVTQVFRSNAEHQGVYDLLSNPAVTADALRAASASACWRRCLNLAAGEASQVIIPFDGTSIGVPDHQGTKRFGSVGTYKNGGKGIQMLTALALTSGGVPIGIAGQRCWTRPTKRRRKKVRRHSLSTDAKETRHTLDLLREADAAVADAPHLSLVFVGDRGNDAGPVLLRLAAMRHTFVIRACWNRRVHAELEVKQRDYLRERLARTKPIGCFKLPVAAGHGRAEREAVMEVRINTVQLVLSSRYEKKTTMLTLNVVQTRERGTTPKGEKPLDWILFTNAKVEDLSDAIRLTNTYALRWRIEDFHRAWKTGACDIEGSRLHTAERLEKWATLLGSVAARVERLKHLSRDKPEAPALLELAPHELAAIVWMKRKIKKRNEIIGESPTMKEAVHWLAQIGGYTGYGRPPGSATIARGLARIADVALLLREQALRQRSDE